MATLHDNSENIILTGFMGTGKTTVGKILAARLEREFVDTDSLIEQRQGRTIPQIFSELGEPAFRRLEAELAQELGQRQGLVISTGGRFMLDPDNVKALSRSGRVFCLVATPQEILARISRDTGHCRPLLEVADPGKQIVDLLEERKRGYQQFVEIKTSGKSPDQISDELLALMARTNLNFPVHGDKERIMARKKLKEHRINREWCKGCGICVRFCPKNVLALDNMEKAVAVRPEECICCRLCEYRCPDLAIEIVVEDENDE